MIKENFTVSPKLKNTAFGVIGLGLLLVIIGLFINRIPVEIKGTTENHFAWTRFWANFLLSGFFFTAVGVLATAFMCIQYLATGGWYVAAKRIFEAFSQYLPIGFAVFVIIILAGFLGPEHGVNALYEWTNTAEVAKDEVLSGKSAWLNLPFFAVRVCIYFGFWILFANKLRKQSIAEDSEPGINWYNKSMRTAATFLPIFGLTFCMATWDWMMSIQPHWYSTMFGVNVFAASLVAMMALVNMTAVLMKRAGYMSWINENHHHDMSKFMFAFSCFWAYTWVSQYLLIWYANLPEETPYYITRLHGAWKWLFAVNFILNFVAPFLLFMTRDSKRTENMIILTGIVVLIGKYIDWYLIIMPNSAKETSGFGFMEIGFFAFFAGLFILRTASSLTKANLIPQNHPFTEETLHHEI